MTERALAELAGHPVEVRCGPAGPPVGERRFDVVLVRHVRWTPPDQARLLRNWRELLRGEQRQAAGAAAEVEHIGGAPGQPAVESGRPGGPHGGIAQAVVRLLVEAGGPRVPVRRPGGRLAVRALIGHDRRVTHTTDSPEQMGNSPLKRLPPPRAESGRHRRRQPCAVRPCGSR
ncbi:class I SAM-dependent methyltransferase [Streptomyces murinus]